MPVDSEGNITTTPSVDVKTITDVMRENNVDTIPLHEGGMARINEDDGSGVNIGSDGFVLTAATASDLGGVKKAATVAALAGGADAAAIATGFNDLVAKLKAAGIVS